MSPLSAKEMEHQAFLSKAKFILVRVWKALKPNLFPLLFDINIKKQQRRQIRCKTRHTGQAISKHSKRTEQNFKSELFSPRLTQRPHIMTDLLTWLLKYVLTHPRPNKELNRCSRSEFKICVYNGRSGRGVERTKDENLNKVETLDSDQKESVWNFQMRPLNLEYQEGDASISHLSQKQLWTQSSHQTVCFYKRTQGEFVQKKMYWVFC